MENTEIVLEQRITMLGFKLNVLRFLSEEPDIPVRSDESERFTE